MTDSVTCSKFKQWNSHCLVLIHWMVWNNVTCLSNKKENFVFREIFTKKMPGHP